MQVEQGQIVVSDVEALNIAHGAIVFGDKQILGAFSVKAREVIQRALPEDAVPEDYAIALPEFLGDGAVACVYGFPFTSGLLDKLQLLHMIGEARREEIGELPSIANFGLVASILTKRTQGSPPVQH